MKRPFRYLRAGIRLVSATPDLDWDRLLGELKTKREKREAEIAESAKHYDHEMSEESISMFPRCEE